MKVTDHKIVEILADSDPLGDPEEAMRLVKKLPNLRGQHHSTLKRKLDPKPISNYISFFYNILIWWKSRASVDATPSKLSSILKDKMGMLDLGDSVFNQIVKREEYDLSSAKWITATSELLGADAALTERWKELADHMNMKADIPRFYTDSGSLRAFWYAALETFNSCTRIHEPKIKMLMEALASMGLMDEHNKINNIVKAYQTENQMESDQVDVAVAHNQIQPLQKTEPMVQVNVMETKMDTDEDDDLL